MAGVPIYNILKSSSYYHTKWTNLALLTRLCKIPKARKVYIDLKRHIKLRQDFQKLLNRYQSFLKLFKHAFTIIYLTHFWNCLFLFFEVTLIDIHQKVSYWNSIFKCFLTITTVEPPGNLQMSEIKQD